MESTITRSGKRVRHNILRKNQGMFETRRKQKLSWLEKLTVNLDMEITKIERVF